MDQERKPKQSIKPGESCGARNWPRRPGKPSRLLKTSQASESTQITQQPNANGPSQLSVRRKKQETEDVRRKQENGNLVPPRMRGIGEASKPKSRRTTRAREETVHNEPAVFEQPTFEPKDQTKPDPKPFQPATFTGFRELPIGKAFLILLLWLPRFFIPWITAWHEFNVYVLSNPWHWKGRNDELFQHNIYVLVGKSIIAIVCSGIVDLIRKKYTLDFCVHSVLLVLFTLSPFAGAMVDVVLRAGFLDEQIYKDWWFTSIVLMQWAMSFAFMMFPVQLACIYMQHNKMSRNAHYNWTSLFVLLEFINAFVAFLVIPGQCPTREWTQIVIWAGILLLMITITMLTLIFFFVVKVLKYAVLTCCNWKTEEVAEKPDPGPFADASSDLKMKKLTRFSMIALPLISSYASFSIIERFVPLEDWDDHHFLSAPGVFHFSKIMGVMLMALLMFIVRKVSEARNPPNQRAEMIYLGLPHCLCFLALVTMVGRFATLSHLNEGDIIVGPIPDNDTAVLVFVNIMFRNRTICISSEYFRPVKIRPQQFATRKIHDIGVENFTVSMEVDPCSEPNTIRTRLRVQNIKKGEWKVYRIGLPRRNWSNLATGDYYKKLISYTLLDVSDLRPKKGPPQMLIFQGEYAIPIEWAYYEMKHSSLGTVGVPANSSYNESRRGLIMNRILWEVPAVGKWSVRFWNSIYNYSAVGRAWVANCSPCVSPLDFEVENNSLYLLIEYAYQEKPVDIMIRREWWVEGPPLHLSQYPMSPNGYVLFKLGEVAGPNSNRLPSNKELQKDWTIKISMALAGMAAGGMFLGFVYLFWVDPPMPRYRTISLAVCWVLMGLASEIPRIKMIDVGIEVSLALLILQIAMTGLHFVGAYFMYTPMFNLRIRPD